MRWRVLLTIASIAAIAATAAAVALTSPSQQPPGSPPGWTIREVGSAVDWVQAVNSRDEIAGSGARQGSDCGGEPAVWQDGRVAFLTRPGQCGVAYGINDRGAAVGEFFGENAEQSGFLWQDGRLAELALVDTMTVATAINDRGQVVGLTADWNSSERSPYTEWDAPRAFLWENGQVTRLTPEDRWSEARGIDDRGRVVGWMKLAPNVWHAFLWEGGRLLDLGTLPGRATSQARGINERGQVVGVSTDDPDGSSDAFLWEDGRMTNLIPDGGLHSVANAIDDRGRVVGSTDALGPDAHAFVWEQGRLTDLGTLPGDTTSEAVAIADNGVVVGTSGGRAVVWTPRGHR